MSRQESTGGEKLPRSVERVEVLVLVDNVTEHSSTPDNVLPERASLLKAGLTEWCGEAICCAHFGFSALVTVHTNGSSHTLLFDGGPEGYAVERNGRRLGVDFSAVDSVVLSHGHWDHAGGLVKALELITESGQRKDVPFYVHPEMFQFRGSKLPNGKVVPHKRVPGVEELTGLGAAVVNSAESQLLLDDTFYLSGEIPRVTAYEKGLANHMRKVEGATDWEADPNITDERYLAVNIRDKGLMVFSACSHAGVINVLTDTREKFPGMPLHGVMGGFHLFGAGPEKLIPETVRDMEKFDPRWIIPCHCTGWRAVMALVTAFGEERVVPGSVGKHFTF